jgi:phosphoserine phosphatase RsbU/P
VRLSIKTKIVLAMGLPLLATYGGMIAIEYSMGKRAALAAMESYWTVWTAGQATNLEAELSRDEELAGTVAVLASASPDMSADQIQKWLEDNLRANPAVFGMCMAFEEHGFSAERKWFAPYCCRDERGEFRHLDIAEAVGDYTRLNWYRPATASRQPFWTEPYFDTGVGQRLMCTYSVPFFRNGEFRGVVTVDVLNQDLLDDITPVKKGSTYCVLLSRRGTFIAHPDLSLVMRESVLELAKRRNVTALEDIGRRMIAGQQGVGRIAEGRDAAPEWVIYTPVKSAGWSLAAVMPEDEVLAPLRGRLARFLGILAGGCVAAMVIVLIVSARVTRPISRLTVAAESLAGGNLDTRVSGVTGSDEIARLAGTFNTMVADLKVSVEGRIREEAARKQVEGELHAARDIQETLLPSMLPPDADRPFTLHAVNAPAKLVAGDFFDFFLVDRRRLAVVMADVSGKGVPAALYMAVTRTKLRDFASADKTPAETVAEVNRCLAKDNDRDMFVTLFFGYYDTLSGELVYVNAGHNPPCLVRQDGSLETLDPTGPLVGPFADAAFEDARVVLSPRDLLVLYTDGVTEAVAPDGGFFSEERLQNLLRSLATRPAEAVCRAAIEAVRAFSPGDLADDATVLALARLGAGVAATTTAGVTDRE